jgi:predicted nucleic acid-binding protein
MAMTMIIVDASVVIASLGNEADSGSARHFMQRSETRLVSVALLMLEVRGVMAKRFTAGRIDRRGLEDWLISVAALIDIRPLDAPLVREAFVLSSLNMDVVSLRGDARPFPANVYDCCYIALARLTGGDLATLDGRQAALASQFSVRTVSL